MARYTDDSREKVRDAVDFVDLVGSRTELRRAGVNRYTGLCPFHDERSPSFGIDPGEKLYHCFGCGAGGDVFKFVMETESLGFGEALELLGDRYNVVLERTEEDPRAGEKRERRDRLLGLLERTAAYYVRLLWEAPEAAGAREYLASRGLQEPTLREFRVGFSPPQWDRVVGASLRAGYSSSEMLGSGLASPSRGRDGLVDRFRGRLMFPWADARGRVLGFGARALAPDDEPGGREGGPKYLNSSEGEVFHKGRQVYGTHLARAAAAKAGSVVLVEGYTDVIALHQAGIRHAVGQMGTALAEGQAGELAKLAPSVALCLDADSAGQEAMLRAAAVLRALPTPPDVRVVPLPSGSDPAEVATGPRGTDEVESMLERSVPFARWEVELALDRGNTSTAEGRDRVLAATSAIIRSLAPSVLREELVQLVAGRLELSEGLAASALGVGAGGGGGRGGRMPRGEGAGNGAHRAMTRREDAEHAFLAFCVAFPSAGQKRLDGLNADALLSGDLIRRAAAHLRDSLSKPASGLPPQDEPLSALIAEIVLRARSLEDADPSDLERTALMLDLARLERGIATARVSQEPVSDLAAERQRVLGELRRLTR